MNILSMSDAVCIHSSLSIFSLSIEQKKHRHKMIIFFIVHKRFSFFILLQRHGRKKGFHNVDISRFHLLVDACLRLLQESQENKSTWTMPSICCYFKVKTVVDVLCETLLSCIQSFLFCGSALLREIMEDNKREKYKNKSFIFHILCWLVSSTSLFTLVLFSFLFSYFCSSWAERTATNRDKYTQNKRERKNPLCECVSQAELNKKK